jgi:hypothetical protein
VLAATANWVHVQSQTCGCNVRPVDRTNVSTEQQGSVQDHLAALPSVQPFFVDAASGIDFAAAAFANLPPPVPHRILHCSWII